MKIKRHFVTVGDVQMHYRRMGAGPVIVWAHPLGSDSNTQLDIARSLAQHMTILLPDLINHGFSDQDKAATSATDYAQNLFDFIKAVHLVDPILYLSDGCDWLLPATAKYAAGSVSMIIAKGGKQDCPLPRTPNLHTALSFWETAIQHCDAQRIKSFDFHQLQQQLSAYLQYCTNAPAPEPNSDGMNEQTVSVPTTVLIDGSQKMPAADKRATGKKLQFALLAHPDDLSKTLLQLAHTGAAVKTPRPPENAPISGNRFTRAFVAFDGREIMVQGRAGTRNEAFVTFHDFLHSSSDLAAKFSKHFPDITMIIPDLPGHGASADHRFFDNSEDFSSFLQNLLLDLPARTAIHACGGLAGFTLSALTHASEKPYGLVLSDPLVIADKELMDWMEIFTRKHPSTTQPYGEHLVSEWGKETVRLRSTSTSMDKGSAVFKARQLASIGISKSAKTILAECRKDRWIEQIEKIDYPVIILASEESCHMDTYEQISKSNRNVMVIEGEGPAGVSAALAGLGIGV